MTPEFSLETALQDDINDLLGCQDPPKKKKKRRGRPLGSCNPPRVIWTPDPSAPYVKEPRRRKTQEEKDVEELLGKRPPRPGIGRPRKVIEPPPPPPVPFDPENLRKRKRKIPKGTPRVRPHPIIWARAFLPHHFTEASPAFHWELIDLIWGPDDRVAIAAPRGFSKSTAASLLCPLYGAAEELYRYGLLISDTKEQAELFLQEIKHECETNELLLKRYPGLRPGKPWSRDELGFSNGILLQAVGTGQKVRGRKHRGRRPDFVVGDDLENDEAVASLARRMKFRRWLRAALLPAMAPDGRIRIVGTILHTDSLLSRLLSSKRWKRRLWSALSEDGHSLWPARFPAEMLLGEKEEAREDGMLATWYQERQNKAIADEESSFKPGDFRQYDNLPEDEPGTVQQWTRSLYVDPAIGENASNDFTAYSIVYSTFEGFWYVVEAFRGRHDPMKVVQTIRDLHSLHQFDSIGIEANAYQKSICFWLKHKAQEDDGLSDLPIEPIISDIDKKRRIMALQPFYRAGRIKHHRGSCDRLELELLNLDSIDHEDVADSLAGHLFINRRPEPPKKRKKRFEASKDSRAYAHRREMIRQGRLKRLGIEE